MRRPIRIMTLFSSAVVLAGALGLAFNSATAEEKKAASAVEEGKAIATHVKKGNCLACHAMDDGDMAGTIGPPLVAMKLRFPDKAVLKAQIVDPRVKNPSSMMPPFGAHEILSDEEIDKIVEYIHTL